MHGGLCISEDRVLETGTRLQSSAGSLINAAGHDKTASVRVCVSAKIILSCIEKERVP